MGTSLSTNGGTFMHEAAPYSSWQQVAVLESSGDSWLGGSASECLVLKHDLVSPELIPMLVLGRLPPGVRRVQH
jgi:hypothetical protein